MKRSKSIGVLIAPMLMAACSGTPHGADAAVAGTTAGPALTADEARLILEASVTARTADALTTPQPGGLPAEVPHSSARFNAAREQEKPVVEARTLRLHGFGFHYTSASTTVEIKEITGTDSKATVTFDEYGTQCLASDTAGPSDVPEQYRVRETATFIMTAEGWVLDEVLPTAGQFGLPFSMVDPRLPG